MRRVWLPIALSVSLLCAAPPAQAGLLSALAKVGSLAGKAGKVVKVGRLGKGAMMLKGAGALTAAVAAERVFARAASGASRIPVFVTKADDGLRVVMKGGDELAHSPSSLQRFTGELDEMAKVADDAGVDVFVDASAVDDVATLTLGPNTRLFLANVDGPSLPLRAGPRGPQIELPGSLWLDLAKEATKAAVQLANVDIEGLHVAAAEACGELSQPRPGAGVHVVLYDHERPPLDGLGDVDVVMLGVDQVCEDGGLTVEAQSRVAEVFAARTLGDLWAMGVADEAVQSAERLVLTGRAFAASHPLTQDLFVEEAEADDDLPEPVKAFLGFLILMSFLGVKLWMAKKP